MRYVEEIARLQGIGGKWKTVREGAGEAEAKQLGTKVEEEKYGKMVVKEF